MHTHFGSATHLGATFVPILIAGSAWRIGWLHVLAAGKKRGSRHMVGFAQAALFQY